MNDNRLKEIYALIGAIALHWSEVEELWYLIFTGLMADTPREQTDAIFFLFETGKRQRDLIISVAKATFKPDKQNRPHKTMRQIGQLINKTETLSPKRNAAVHANMFIHQTLEGQTSYRIDQATPLGQTRYSAKT